MSFTILVLHGPNLHWLGSDDVDERLEARASELGVDLSIVQSNGEGALIDELHEQEDEYDAVIVNPGAIAPNAWALAEALQLVGVPAVEVLLKPLAPERGPSALAGVVQQQIHGKGHDGYLHALEALAGVRGPALTPVRSPERLEEEAAEEEDEDEAGPVKHVSRPGKSIGRKGQAKEAAPARPAKSIGRRDAKGGNDAAAKATAKSLGRKEGGAAKSGNGSGLSRAQVREKVALRLARKLAPDALAAWARAEWSALQTGAPCEAGQRELLDEVLLTLMAGAKVSEDVLLAQMAKL
ncbi:MAG: type II 3-dehydroquinate dehydratase [Myxococcota bacterium]